MEIPSLVRDGLYREFEHGYNSDAIHLLYQQTKKPKEEISKMVRETWDYINSEKVSNHIVCHFLYLLHHEVNREWIQDISIDIVKYGLNHKDVEVIDETIGLIERWDDKDLLEMLYNTEIEVEWLNDYKNQVLKDCE